MYLKRLRVAMALVGDVCAPRKAYDHTMGKHPLSIRVKRHPTTKLIPVRLWAPVTNC